MLTTQDGKLWLLWQNITRSTRVNLHSDTFPAISIVAKILFSGRFSSFTMCTLPSVESKVIDNNSSSVEESAWIMLTPLRGRLFLPGALLHISAKWFGLLQALHTLPNAGHLKRCLTWLLPQCLQHFSKSTFDSGTGCFGPLLRRFGGAFDFLRLSSVFTVSAGLSVLIDCPLIALRWALVASADLQISKHFSNDTLGSCNNFRRTLFSVIPHTRRSRNISSFKAPNLHVAAKARSAVA